MMLKEKHEHFVYKTCYFVEMLIPNCFAEITENSRIKYDEHND